MAQDDKTLVDDKDVKLFSKKMGNTKNCKHKFEKVHNTHLDSGG